MNFQPEIKRLIAVYSSNKHSISEIRFWKLKAINDFYSVNGFPKPCSLPELSLLPAYFQEAIYDGINWSEQNAELEHLDTELELDCIFHNCGRSRKELSSKEFKDYVYFSDAAINGASLKPKSTLISRLLARVGLSI